MRGNPDERSRLAGLQLENYVILDRNINIHCLAIGHQRRPQRFVAAMRSTQEAPDFTSQL